MAKKLSIISFSGDFDKLTAVFTLATGAAAVGYEVNLFFTFWGLNAIKKKQGRSFLGKSALTKVFGFLMGGLKVAPVSRLNFGGISPKVFRSLMKKNNVATLEELVEAAKLLQVNFYACEMAMHILGLTTDDFVPEVKDVLGVATFLKIADDGQPYLFERSRTVKKIQQNSIMATYKLDITKEHCPMTFVKTKIELAKLNKGDIIEVLLVEGEPLENVPRTTVEQGYKVLSVEALEGDVHKVTIQK